MAITNTNLKDRAQRAIALQEKGLFIVDRRYELPLPSDESLRRLSYTREQDENGRSYDYQNAWGFFSSDVEEHNLLILRRGEPPENLLPQPRLGIATATIHTGYVTIHSDDGDFEIDLKTPETVSWGTLQLINETLQAENMPLVVWSIEQVPDEAPPVIRIANASAMLFASSAIWSMEDQQLVAAHVVTTSQELLKAIKATLANNNSKSYLTVKTPEDSAYLRSARRGYTAVSNHLTAVNADGTVTALLHPLSGDPQANAASFFYIIVAPGEAISQKFAERLDLAVPWPVQPAWADYLLEAGQDAGLVEVLPGCGVDFSAGLRVVKNESQWQQVISSGLKEGRIRVS